MLPQQFLQGVEQFNSQAFYACHDTLEALWIEASEPDKTFYQGILQIAVACYHLTNHNQRGATILLGEGIGKLRHYQPDYEDIDVTQLLEESRQLLAVLQQLKLEEIASFVEQLENSPNSTFHFPRLSPREDPETSLNAQSLD